MPSLRHRVLCFVLMTGHCLRADDKAPTLEELADNLMQSCQMGNEDEARKCLAKGADPNSRVERWSEQTPLNSAASSGSLGIVRLLLEHGARSKMTDLYGRTPLHVAASSWKPEAGDEIERLLLDSGAPVNAKDSAGLTPLAYAARYGPEGMRLLLEAGAEADRGAIMEAASWWRLDSIKLLLQRGAPLRDREPAKPTLMHAVANAQLYWYGTPRMDDKEVGHLLDFLLDLHVPVDDPDRDGATPLLLACEKGHEAVARWLMEHGADCNKAALNGFTPLMLAAQFRASARSLMKDLIEHGSRLDALNANHDTPLDCALYVGNWDTADALLDAGAKSAASAEISLFLATEAAQGKLPGGVLPYLLGRLVEAGRADIKDEEGTPLLIWCVRAGDADAVRVVLDAGASAVIADASARTPLHWAAIAGSKKMVKLIVDAGAKPEALDDSGRTAADYDVLGGFRTDAKATDEKSIQPPKLVPVDGEADIFLAVQTRNAGQLRELLSKHPSAVGEKRGSLQPLQLAAMLGWEEGVQMLLDLGATKLLQEDSEPPAALAARNGHVEIAIRLLRQKGRGLDESKTAIVYSAALGNDQMAAVSQLMAAGVPPGETAQVALCQAAEKNDVDLCKQLLAAGGSASILAEQTLPGDFPRSWRDAQPRSALGHAAAGDAVDTLRLLLREAKELPGAEHHAILADALCAAAGAGSIKAAKILLKEEHVDPNADLSAGKFSSSPEAALSKAVAGGHAAMVDLLLQHGAKVSAAEAAGDTLLGSAMDAGNRDLFFLMLRSGANVNATVERWASEPLLHVAVERWDDEIVRALVGAGADLEVHDRQQQTVVELARQQGRAGLAKWLEQELSKGTPRIKAGAESSRKQ